AGRFLVTAPGSFDVDSLSQQLAKLPGFQSAVEDWLFPESALKTTVGQGGLVGSQGGQGGQGPTPVPALTEIGAGGTLVFSGSVSQSVGSGSNITFSVNLDIGQTLAAIITPDSNLKATLKITDAKNKVQGSATGSAPGALTAIQAITVGNGNAGTWTITVG